MTRRRYEVGKQELGRFQKRAEQFRGEEGERKRRYEVTRGEEFRQGIGLPSKNVQSYFEHYLKTGQRPVTLRGREKAEFESLVRSRLEEATPMPQAELRQAAPSLIARPGEVPSGAGLMESPGTTLITPGEAEELSLRAAEAGLTPAERRARELLMTSAPFAG